MKNTIPLLLAAGFGTRLGELTKNTPKPLVNLGDHRLIEGALYHLARAGFTEVIINLHYLADQIKDFLGDGSKWGINVIYSYENEILDTGGAIKRVLPIINGRNVLVFNSDAIFGKELDLQNFIKHTKDLPPDVMAILLLTSSGKVAEFGGIDVVDDPELDLRVVGLPNLKPTQKSSFKTIVFAGIHLIRPTAFKYFDQFGDIFSSTKDFYPAILNENGILAAKTFAGFWCDTGTKDRLKEAAEAVTFGKVGFITNKLGN